MTQPWGNFLLHTFAVLLHLRPPFAYILDRYGHAPNRRRTSACRGEAYTYYYCRSVPVRRLRCEVSMPSWQEQFCILGKSVFLQPTAHHPASPTTTKASSLVVHCCIMTFLLLLLCTTEHSCPFVQRITPPLTNGNPPLAFLLGVCSLRPSVRPSFCPPPRAPFRSGCADNARRLDRFRRLRPAERRIPSTSWRCRSDASCSRSTLRS